MQSARLSPKQRSAEYFKEYSQSTSLHGVRYVGENKVHLIERIFWIIVMLIFAVLCGLEVAKVWKRWRSSPVIMSFAQQPTNVASVPYPAITICPETRVKRSVLDVARNKDRIEKQLEGKVPYDSPAQKLLVEAMTLQCWTNEDDPSYLFPSNAPITHSHIETLVEKITPSIEDVFESCVVNSNVLSCKDVVRPVMTAVGVCHAFNMLDEAEFYNTNKMNTHGALFEKSEASLSTWDIDNGYSVRPKDPKSYPYRSDIYVSRFFGIKLTLKSPEPKDLQTTCASSKNIDDFRLTLQPPNEYPDVFYGNVFRAVAGAEMSVSIKPNFVSTSDSLRKLEPNIRKCYFRGEKNLTMFNTYTKQNCLVECEHKMYYLYCDKPCTQYIHPQPKRGNLPLCTTLVLNNSAAHCGPNYDARVKFHFTDERYDSLDDTGEIVSCGCLPACSELSYDFNVGIMPLSREDSNLSSQIERRAVISIFYDTESFYARQRTEMYSITDFVASAGGLLSLFSGFSLVSLVEVCYFATLRLACKYRARRTKDATPEQIELEDVKVLPN